MLVMSCSNFWLPSLLLLASLTKAAVSFTVPVSGSSYVHGRHQGGGEKSSCVIRQSSVDGDSGEGGDKVNDALRRVLESSWNTASMGTMPTSPDIAATEAAVAVRQAKMSAGVEKNNNIFFVDIMLPQYDKGAMPAEAFERNQGGTTVAEDAGRTGGGGFYDEVLAVEFCISLAQKLHDSPQAKACIVVRDGNAARAVNRVLDSREKAAHEKKQRDALLGLLDENEEGNNDNNNNNNDDDDKNDLLNEINEYVDELDSSKEDGNKSNDANENDDIADEDIENFRKNLMFGWNALDDGSGTKDNDAISADTSTTDDAPPTETPEKSRQETSDRSKQQSTEEKRERNYRIGSMFGDDIISKGPDRMGDVVTAISKYGAQPTDEEETLIILSAVTAEETIGVRSLVTKFGLGQQQRTTTGENNNTMQKKKTILLVNCGLGGGMMPRELLKAETAYSITPLVAKQTKKQQQRNNLLGDSEKSRNDQEEDPPLKVVILRRYPKDWEIHVDVNDTGFQLIDSIPSSRIPQSSSSKGPSMEYISRTLGKYLETQ